MAVSAEDLENLVNGLRYDATALQGKISELKRMIAQLDLPSERPSYPCSECGVAKNTETALEDHLANVHETAGDFHRKIEA